MVILFLFQIIDGHEEFVTLRRVFGPKTFCNDRFAQSSTFDMATILRRSLDSWSVKYRTFLVSGNLLNVEQGNAARTH